LKNNCQHNWSHVTGYCKSCGISTLELKNKEDAKKRRIPGLCAICGRTRSEHFKRKSDGELYCAPFGGLLDDIYHTSSLRFEQKDKEILKNSIWKIIHFISDVHDSFPEFWRNRFVFTEYNKITTSECENCGLEKCVHVSNQCLSGRKFKLKKSKEDKMSYHNDNPLIHIDKHGTRHPIAGMDTQHLLNTLNLHFEHAMAAKQAMSMDFSEMDESDIIMAGYENGGSGIRERAKQEFGNLVKYVIPVFVTVAYARGLVVNQELLSNLYIPKSFKNQQVKKLASQNLVQLPESGIPGNIPEKE